MRKKVYKSDHLWEVFSKLNKDRKSSQTYCDVTLTAESSNFETHKCILGAFSSFYDKLFTSEMKEKYENKANIQEVSRETMEIVLNFIYTCDVEITSDNVYDLLEASNYMEIPYLKRYCIAFLNDEIDATNCLSIRAYAKRYDIDALAKKADAVIADKFQSIIGEEEFKQLNIDQVSDLMQLKEKQVSTEESVYHALIGWIKHDVPEREKHVVKLFSLLTLDRLPGNFIQNVVLNENLIMKSHECTKMALLSTVPRIGKEQNVQNSHAKTPENPDQKNPASIFKKVIVPVPIARASVQNQAGENSANIFKKVIAPVPIARASVQNQVNEDRKTFPKKVITKVVAPVPKANVPVGNPVHDVNVLGYLLKEVQKYDIKRKVATKMPSTKFAHSDGSAVHNEKMVFLIGGEQNHLEWLNLGEKNADWIELTPPDKHRWGAASVVCNDSIFNVGGGACGSSSSVCESFNIDGNRWSPIAEMNVRRRWHSLVYTRGLIFALGGCKGVDGLHTGESLDPREGLWTKIPPMNSARFWFSSCVLNNGIYVMGGRNHTLGITHNTAEQFDPRNQKWINVAPMNVERFRPVSCAREGKIYVAGGFNDTIEVYDSIQNTWKMEGNISGLEKMDFMFEI